MNARRKVRIAAVLRPVVTVVVEWMSVSADVTQH